MRWKEPDGALRGRDGRIVYASDLAQRAYRLLKPETRRLIMEDLATGEPTSKMVRHLDRSDFVDDLPIASASFTISDCVATCDFAFATEDGLVYASSRRFTMATLLPETLAAAIPGMDMSVVTGLAILSGIRAGRVREQDRTTVIHYDDGTGHLIEDTLDSTKTGSDR